MSKQKQPIMDSFLKLFKPLTARACFTSLKFLGLRPRILNLIKNCCSCFKHYINNGTDMSIVFCEFSLFLNIKYLHNIRIISTIKHGLILGLCPTLPQTFMKVGAKHFEISWLQANKQPNTCEYVTFWGQLFKSRLTLTQG